MIRLFNVYYPIRTLVLFGGEALLVLTSFLIAAVWQHPYDSYVVLNYEGGYFKIIGATVAVLIFCWARKVTIISPARAATIA